MDYFPLDDQEYQDGLPVPGLRLFLDSADPVDWQRFLPSGAFHGVTTNPLLLERAGQACTLKNLERLTRAAGDLGALEIHLQTWGDSPEEMVHIGSQLALLEGVGLNVAVKVPATEMGLAVARQLREAGATVTLTAVYNPGQVLLAAGFGAAYAAPYLGRLNDQGRDGRQAILAMRDILYATQSTTRLLVASLRSAETVIELAQAGLDTLTFGAPVAADLLKENLTDAAAADFQRAARAMSKEQ
jgi:transaldolase